MSNYDGSGSVSPLEHDPPKSNDQEPSIHERLSTALAKLTTEVARIRRQVQYIDRKLTALEARVDEERGAS